MMVRPATRLDSTPCKASAMPASTMPRTAIRGNRSMPGFCSAMIRSRLTSACTTRTMMCRAITSRLSRVSILSSMLSAQRPIHIYRTRQPVSLDLSRKGRGIPPVWVLSAPERSALLSFCNHDLVACCLPGCQTLTYTQPFCIRLRISLMAEEATLVSGNSTTSTPSRLRRAMVWPQAMKDRLGCSSAKR